MPEFQYVTTQLRNLLKMAAADRPPVHIDDWQPGPQSTATPARNVRNAELFNDSRQFLLLNHNRMRYVTLQVILLG